MTQTRYYVNTAVATTLSVALNNTDVTTVFTVAAMTGYPSVPFTVVLDAGTASEELIYVTDATSTTITATRGAHGTTKRTHAIGGTFKHCASAQDFTDANAHINAAAGDAHAGHFPVLAGSSAGDTVTLRVGSISGTTEADGTLVVTHGMGTTPSGVLASLSTDNTYLGTVGTIGATTFKIMVCQDDDNTTWASSAVTGSFLAWTTT